MENTKIKNKLLLDAIAGKKMPRPPIWLMRQAGRSDPKYNKLKESFNLPLETLFRDSDKAIQLSVLPSRFGVDAIIFYQDILTILEPMGANFVFRPGPILEKPIESVDDLRQLKKFDVADKMPYVYETIKGIYQTLDFALPVLGFAGAPLTLAVFLLQGKSFASEGIDRFMKFKDENPDALRDFLDLLTDQTISYLKMQRDAGAVAVQLFESAAYYFDSESYRQWALPYQQKIFAALKGEIKTIAFAHNYSDLDLMEAAGSDIISLPSTIPIHIAKEKVKDPSIIFQGNLSKSLLRSGSMPQIENEAIRIIKEGECHRHIFNLDHGLFKDTPFDNIRRLVELVRSYG